MKLLDKLREKINNPKTQGIVMAEDWELAPIPFRTIHGGSRPGNFVVTKNMKLLKKNVYSYIDKIVSAGLTDEYSDPGMFDKFIEANFQQIKNDILEQGIKLDLTAVSITEVEEASYLKGKRDEAQLKEYIEPKNSLEKGKGKKYENIQEK